MHEGLVIRTRELGGKLVSLGGDHARGITVEAPSFQADGWGPSGGQFTLKRSPRVQWPDLRAYAPLTVEAFGVPVWRGRIKGTPMTDGGLARQISVNAEGAQYRLDDDVIDRKWVSTNLADWKDCRSSLLCQLGNTEFTAAAQVTVGGGMITMQTPVNTPLAAGARMGVYWDAGPGQKISQFSLDYVSSANSANNLLYVRGYDTPIWGSNEQVVGTCFAGGANNVFTSGCLNGVLSVPCRYLHILDFTTPGYTPAADVWWRFTGIRIFRLGAYATGTLTAGSSSLSAIPVSSILRSSTVITETLDLATMLLSTDRSLVQSSSFLIPEFQLSAPATVREVVTAANAYHAWQTRVRADNRFEFRPLPLEPLVEVGADSRFDEASAGDATEVYSGCIVSYTDASGAPQRAQRSQPATTYDTSGYQFTNPGFETDILNWITQFWGTGTASRDTVVFDSGIASLKMAAAANAAFGIATQAFTGAALVPGQSYRVSFSMRVDQTLIGSPWAYVQDANGVQTRIGLGGVGVGVWQPYSIDFVPTTTTLYGVSIGGLQFGFGTAGNANFDSFVITSAQPTIIDRWGFRRVKVLETNMTLTDAAAQQIGDVFLAGHKLTPLKGRLVVTGDGRARRAPGGAGMTCAELLTMTGEQVRMRHLVDPDTGKLGRVGRIASVTWDGDANTAALEIDSTSVNFEALLARLAVVTGQVRA